MLTYLLVASIGLTLMALAHSSWKNGLCLVLLTFLTNAILVDPIAIQLGPFTASLEDIVCTALFAAAALRIPFGRNSRARWAWIFFAMAGLAVFAVSCGQYGVKAAGVEYREIYYVSAAILYFAAFPFESTQLRSLVRWWIFFAGALVLLAAFRWAAMAVGFANPEQWAEVGGSKQIRVLNARQAFFICEAAVMALGCARWTRNRARLGVMGALLLGSIIFLEHRSVWVALAASCVVLYGGPGWCKSKRVWAAIVLAAMVGAVALFWISHSTDDVSGSLRTSVLEPFDTQDSTLAWRFAMWRQYLDDLVDSGPRGILSGLGFGAGRLYFVNGAIVDNSPHNLYILTASRLGVTGLALLAAGYWLAARRLWRMRKASPEARLILALIAGQAIFYCAYEFGYDEGVITGVAAAFTAARTARIRTRRGHSLATESSRARPDIGSGTSCLTTPSSS